MGTPLTLEVSIATLESARPSAVLSLPALSGHIQGASLQAPFQRGFTPSAPHPAAKLDPLLRLAVKRFQQGALGNALVQTLGTYTAQAALGGATSFSELGAFEPRGPVATGHGVRPERFGVLISLNGASAPLRALGIRPSQPYGNVVTAQVSLSQLVALAQLPEVAYIEASTRLAPTLDESVPSVRGNAVHEQTPTATGKGVFLGAVDTGIDWSHRDFRLDADGNGSEEASRIAFIWDQTEQSPVGHRGSVPFGTEYRREDIDIDLALDSGFDHGRVRERDENGHGTHVMGIQGGDGSASNKGFVGMAPEATLGFVKTTFASSDVIEGVSYLFDRGASLGMPTVVNLSLGGHFGPHDGSGAFERALDAMVGPGRIVVNSAGNEGNDRVHVSGDLNHSRYSVDFVANAQVVALSFWYPGQTQLEVTLDSPGFGDAIETFRAATGQLVESRWNDSVITLDNASQGPYPFNGDNNLLIVLENIDVDTTWTITLNHLGGAGHFDGWVALSSFGEFSKSDPTMTISEPGNARRIITVGAYTSKRRWDSILGRTFGFVSGNPVGDIATFSSSGPTRDGRQKPDLNAPGTAVVSTLAAGSELGETLPLVDPDGVHVALQGTSMAAPHVAGAIALLLQADPNLNERQVMMRLRGTAHSDTFTGPVPNLVWGFGKLDALLGLDSLSLPLPLLNKGVSLKVGQNAATQRAFFYYLLPEGTASADLMVFDALGNRVALVALDPAQTRLAWDLRDNHGAPLSNGLYLCLVVADGVKSKVHPLVVRRG